MRRRYGGAGQRETTSQAATIKRFLFSAAGQKVLQIADYPGLLVWRTVAMLVNEALDALQKGVASAEDIDTAMRLGVNYPRARWRGVNHLAGAGCCGCWKTCNSTMAKSAIAPVPCCARRR
jgi:3-hydroxyacyl-CoA dehydrogenase